MRENELRKQLNPLAKGVFTLFRVIARPLRTRNGLHLSFRLYRCFWLNSPKCCNPSKPFASLVKCLMNYYHKFIKIINAMVLFGLQNNPIEYYTINQVKTYRFRWSCRV